MYLYSCGIFLSDLVLNCLCWVLFFIPAYHLLLYHGCITLLLSETLWHSLYIHYFALSDFFRLHIKIRSYIHISLSISISVYIYIAATAGIFSLFYFI